MKFVICKDRHLHIPKPNVEIYDDESPSREVIILVATQNTKGVYRSENRIEQNRILPKMNNQNKKRESNPSDSRVTDSDEESDD